MESGLGTISCFKCWRAALNSLCEKLSEIFTGSDAVALQRLDNLEKQLEMNYNQRPRVSYF